VPPVTRISSRQHAVVHRFREAVRQPPPGEVLLDGDHLITDALDAAVPVEVLVSSGRFPELAARARQTGAQVFDATPDVIDAVSPVRTPSGIVALARWTPARLAEVFGGPAPLLIGMSGVQDPGNAGSVIRTADALGASAALALDATAHPGGWKALRGAMGATFRLPVATGDAADAVTHARAHQLQIVATVAARGAAPDAVDLARPTLLLLGSEGAGLSDALVKQCDTLLTIPMRPGTNSLNVAATAAILLYEARRQRAAGPSASAAGRRRPRSRTP
jgi:TrmH family RNA methyltransferase